ncbi:Uncharacterised protein [Enterobacter hormaechei]|nr:Uncharacterised protein [Enterobacter hormaechei]
MELQQRHDAGPHGHQVRTQAGGVTHRFDPAFDDANRVTLATAPAVGSGQRFDVSRAIDVLVLGQTGRIQFAFQVDAAGHTANGFGFFVEHRLRLLAIVHRRGQIVLVENQVQLAGFLTYQNVTVSPHGTLGVILHKSGFTEGRHGHTFLIGKDNGEDALANESGIFITACDAGQHRVNDALTL